MTGELVSLKNITTGSKNPLEAIKAAFYSSLSFIYTLLYLYYKSNTVEIKGW